MESFNRLYESARRSAWSAVSTVSVTRASDVVTVMPPPTSAPELRGPGKQPAKKVHVARSTVAPPPPAAAAIQTAYDVEVEAVKFKLQYTWKKARALWPGMIADHMQQWQQEQLAGAAAAAGSSHRFFVSSGSESGSPEPRQVYSRTPEQAVSAAALQLPPPPPSPVLSHL